MGHKPKKQNCEELCLKFIFMIDLNKEKYIFYRATLSITWLTEFTFCQITGDNFFVSLKCTIESVLKSMELLNFYPSSYSTVIKKGWNHSTVLVIFKSILISGTTQKIFFIMCNIVFVISQKYIAPQTLLLYFLKLYACFLSPFFSFQKQCKTYHLVFRPDIW